MTPSISIVHIITGLSTGGAEMSLYRLLSRLSERYRPRVISLTSIGEVGRRIQDLGIPVTALGMARGLAGPSSLYRLTRELKALKPDLVHTWMYHADLAGGLAARMAGVPAVTWSIRNSTLDAEKTKWTTRAVVRVCAVLSRRLPDKIISCSRAARDIHIAAGYDASRFVILPNGYDLSSFHPDPLASDDVRRELQIPVGVPVIGIVGRFDPQKNHQGFIEAAGILHAVRPDVYFMMIGKNIDENNQQIAAWLKQAGIVHVTRLTGLRNDIPRLTAAFDVAVTSSSWGEAFPNVVGEAMACGVPCVVTDVGDAAHIVGDTGRVVPPGEMTSLAEAMKYLVDLTPSERKALGAHARARMAEHFELGNVVRQYEAFYDNLLDHGKNRNGTC